MWNNNYSNNNFNNYQSMDVGGGSNFGGGISGGGGGFIQDQPRGTSGSGTPISGSQDKKNTNRTHSLIPVTVAQLLKATEDQGDTYQISGREVYQITFVGVIRSVTESAAYTQYAVDDMTESPISVRRWVDSEETANDRNRKSDCREDTYVRVVGHLRALQGVRYVMAINIQPIEDCNEITYHILEVIHSHLLQTKGPAIPTTEHKNTSNVIQTDFAGGNEIKSLSGLQQQVYSCISASNADQGHSIREISQRLRGISENEIRNATEFLSKEGHIYSTIDDDHFKSTYSS
ncbi:Replication protein A 32 kDa subunit [Trichoplax sp. H2]|nr:Replication protein A 32 kDa subunit [Trichoplax sp. H2]|eukprot:RDD37685.1 Replication protein A 32 kDa subunit [Trichoplax sp. H2]